jgi:tetratricopeptide (TPR) repeat protein
MKSKLLIVLLLTFCSLLTLGQDYDVIQNKDGSKSFHEGSLKIKEGMPFLTVKGDSYEMGLQYGVLMNDMLLDMDHTVDSLIDSYIGSFFIKKWIAGIVLKSKIKKVEETMPSEYLKELEGIAEGSELKIKDLQVIAYFPQLFFKISCTAFIMKNENGIVHGRNLDWPGIEVLTHHPLVVNYHKKDKIPITVLTFMAYPGVYTGMNHNGLSMSINMNGTPAENDKEISDYNTGMPLAFKLRNILENTDNLKGTDKLFKGYSSHAWFIAVGSKLDNSGAIYELTRGEVIKNEMKDDFLFVVNLSLSDKGKYQYSPIWMFGTSNTSRDRKVKELYERIDDNDLISKSYKILTNTENHHMSHDPFYRYSINNSITVKSCIMDNMNNQIYFTYGERLAALNKYLHYDVTNGSISVYKQKQEASDHIFLDERLKYQKWYSENYSGKKKIESEDYQAIINQIEKCDLEPAYENYLLSYYYSKLKDHEKAFINAEKYIKEKPDYYHSYYNKYQIMRDKGEYMDAIVALEEMLQTSTINPYYEYLADLYMIEMFDKLAETMQDQMYIDKINNLADKIRENLTQYFIDERTQKDLKLIKSIEDKYKN